MTGSARFARPGEPGERRAARDRGIFRILATNPPTGKAVKRKANKALGGTPEELRHFITVGQYQA
ncbi:ALF repeat-containing protein [Streptomyces sp. NPDC090021]|uniref:ALF repeat-containing protein n=1 Tax=Streptomyces sp. NPDC090021 TaxID=3365919 RepID=UPI00381E655D